MNTICFTGRRPNVLAGYDDIDKYAKFIDYLADLLESYVTDDTTFITGGAQGFDQLAFWAADIVKARVNKFSVRNVVYVPHKRQPVIWRSEDGLFGKANYRKMIAKADFVKYLRGDIYDKHEICEALIARNHAMVSDSNYIIALYPDDSWRSASGGTSECMRYAHNRGKLIKQITYTINNDGELIATGVVPVQPNT